MPRRGVQQPKRSKDRSKGSLGASTDIRFEVGNVRDELLVRSLSPTQKMSKEAASQCRRLGQFAFRPDAPPRNLLSSLRFGDGVRPSTESSKFLIYNSERLCTVQ